MNKKATIQQIEFLLGIMKSAQAEHPKATIYYDWENTEMRITYPLPNDFNKIKDIKFQKGGKYDIGNY